MNNSENQPAISHLYRYEQNIHTENGLISSAALLEYKFNVTSNTPKGFWIDFGGINKWVSADSKKKYAYPTKEEALESFKRRKLRQIKIVKHILLCAQAALVAAEKEAIRPHMQSLGTRG
jgi:hypothetical protein